MNKDTYIVHLTSEQLHALHWILQERIFELSHRIRTAPHDIVVIAHRQFDQAENISQAIGRQLTNSLFDNK